MYSTERRREIIKLVATANRVNVSDLAAHFGVSPATIRRDLNHLHQSGLLERTYGGALAPSAFSAAGLAAVPDRVAQELSFDERKVSHLEEKERIGRFAATLVRAGETIFIDGGTTTECMVPHLAGIPGLTVVTFGLNIINRLLACESATVIVIGGTLNHGSLTMGGILALDNMQAYNMRFDHAFLAAGGVSAKDGITNPSLEQIPIKRRAIEAARTRSLLADSSKVGGSTTGQIAPVTAIERVITGSQAPADQVAALRDLGLTVDIV